MLVSGDVAVDMQGLRGTARVVPAAALRPLPPIREQRSEFRRSLARDQKVPDAT